MEQIHSSLARVTMTIGLPPELRGPRYRAAARKVIDQLDPHVRNFLAEELEGALRRLHAKQETRPAEKQAGTDKSAASRSASSSPSTRMAATATEPTDSGRAGGPVITCAWEWDPVQHKWVYKCHAGG